VLPAVIRREVNMMRFKNILCVFEGGEICQETLARAVALAEQSQGKLMVIAVTEPFSKRIGKKQSEPASVDPLILETLVEPYRDQVEIQTKVMISKPLPGIVREVMENGHDLVIKRPVSRFGMKQFLSNTDWLLFSKCRCPVWFNELSPSRSSQNILAVVDVSDECFPAELTLRKELNRQILEMASSMALTENGQLHIMQAWHLFGESALRSGFIRMPEEKILTSAEQLRQKHAAKLDTLMDGLAGSLGREALDTVNPQIHLVKGAEQNEIPALANLIAADLVIMGTIVRAGVSGYIMGNNAKVILKQLDSSLLVIKPLDLETLAKKPKPVSLA